jgi:hypothetical protein
MFCVCNIPKKEDNKFILFDKQEDVEIEQFGLENKQNITFEDVISTYKSYPILSLNDFAMRVFNPKARTTTHILGENNINSFEQLENEYNLIAQKKSNLSKSQRELIEKRYNELLNV